MHSITISSGELIDRIVILELKYHAAPINRQAAIANQLQGLKDIYNKWSGHNEGIDIKFKQLQRVNQKLWHLEDEIRIENHIDKSNISTQIAIVNDIRSIIKRDIDILAGETSAECKTYQSQYSSRLMIELWIEIELNHLQELLVCNRDVSQSGSKEFMRFLHEQFGLQLTPSEADELVTLSAQQLLHRVDERALTLTL